MVTKFTNEEASIQGLVLFFLMLIFGVAFYMWLTLPMTGGISNSVTLFWASSTTVPDAAYEAGFANLASLNSGPVIAMLIVLLASISFLIIALRSKFSIT